MRSAAIRLTAEERRELQQISLSGSEKRRARARALVVLLTDAGQSATQIVHVIGMPLRTVKASRRRWRQQAFEGLHDAPRAGRPPKADASYIRKMLAAVEKDPRSLGFAFARWTAPRLVTYLREQTGVTVSPEWLAKLLRKHGFVWRRTKLTTRNLQDPAAVKRAARQLRRLKGGLSSRTPPMSCGSAMGCTSTSYRS